MNEQLRQAMADAAGVDVDSPSTAIGDALLLPASTRNEPAPGFRIETKGVVLRLWQGATHHLTSTDRAWIVSQSWHKFRQTDQRAWVLA